MMYCIFSLVYRVSPQNGGDIGYLVTGIGIVSLPALLAVPIAIYFAGTVKPPSMPYILLIPTAVLFCCCKLQRTKPFVFCIGIVINVMAVLYIALHGTVIGFTLFAEPFAVITNALVLFTITAYLFTPKRQRPHGRGTTILHAVVLIPLLAMVGCYCAVPVDMPSMQTQSKTIPGLYSAPPSFQSFLEQLRFSEDVDLKAFE